MLGASLPLRFAAAGLTLVSVNVLYTPKLLISCERCAYEAFRTQTNTSASLDVTETITDTDTENIKPHTSPELFHALSAAESHHRDERHPGTWVARDQSEAVGILASYESLRVERC